MPSRSRIHLYAGGLATVVWLSISSTAAIAADKPADLVPPAIRALPVVQIPMGITYPPYEFYGEDNKTAQGLDVDIISAVGEVLNLKFEFVNQAVPSLVPAIQNGRYPFAISAMFDRPSDQQQVDFVDYMTSGTVLLVQKGNPLNIRSWSDLCGKRGMGTVGQPSLLLLEEESKKCSAAGKPAIDVQAGPGTSARLAALKSGRTDAIPTDGAVAAYLSSRNSDIYEPAGPVIGKHLLGIVFKKGDTALQTAVQAALRQIKADGRYDKILAKWGVADGGLKDFTINGANSE